MSVCFRFVLAVLMLILGSAIVVPGAVACGSYGGTDYTAYDCVTSVQICDVIGSVWMCNLDVDDGGDPEYARGFMIYDPDHDICVKDEVEYDYCAWGYDDNDERFCCLENPVDWTGAVLIGGDQGDVLQFQYDEDSTEYNLYGYDADPDTIFDGMIEGGGGQDHIYGSRYYGPRKYNDVLSGGDGWDYIEGDEGGDHLDGGDGDDTILGGTGEDWIEGGEDGDYIWGDGGIDHINGGPGDDTIYGGAENDVIHGNTDGDLICGENDNDVAYGDDGDDVLCGNGGTDFAYAGPSGGYDSCDAETEDPLCDGDPSPACSSACAY